MPQCDPMLPDEWERIYRLVRNAKRLGFVNLDARTLNSLLKLFDLLEQDGVMEPSLAINPVRFQQQVQEVLEFVQNFRTYIKERGLSILG